MYIQFHSVVVLYQPGLDIPVVQFYEPDKHLKLLPVNESSQVYWTIDNSPVVIGGEKTRTAFCNRKIPDNHLRAIGERFFAENDAILRTVQYHKDTAEKYRLDLIRLTGHILPRILRFNDIPLESFTLNHTEDGRLFPYLSYRPQPDKSLPRDEQNRLVRAYTKSGVICPECCSFEVKCTGSVFVSGDRHHTIHSETWVCRDCDSTWKHRRVWSD